MQDLRAASLIADLATLASRAGEAIMRHRGCAAAAKHDGSPVTAADHAADGIIAEGLARLLPGIPVLSEERTEAFAPDGSGTFVLVDPLDGTREFVSGSDDFTVNIAIVTDARPLTGIVYAPATGRLWTGGSIATATRVAPGDGARLDGVSDRIAVRTCGERLTAVASRSHRDEETNACLARLPIADLRSAGSSLKFCLVAEGEADIYPRFGPTMEWDTAAGHAVLAAAGGVVVTPSCHPFLYGKAESDYRNGPFIAAASLVLAQRACR
ncbi:3'(2'),5'-bisphosphate nucleotidase CysQ [uncultured Alsobacter sp.]|uniref:3'(2'),5'-bisphosphate nucleotidase CysQ n=1 Tax=uncultured Alsobacter sp. TaxID=1748258 RepID=UPI0025F4BF06|nr:3'(2'),5'-bisphosphate nucleotidase CysQ [uncultured Alsobacter sp.]